MTTERYRRQPYHDTPAERLWNACCYVMVTGLLLFIAWVWLG